MADLTDAIGTWTTLRDPAVAELAAGAGYDFVVLDTEHAPIGIETAADCLRAIDAGGRNASPPPLSVLRVPWNDPVRIKRLLDLGPDGLLVPMVDTPDAARAAVAATRYPPAGERGVAAARASAFGRTFEDYVRETHREHTLIVQIETETAIEHVADIAAVDGVDALFVGPADLSASMGRFGEWTDDAFVEAVETVLTAGEAADVPVGTLGGFPERIRTLGQLGFDFVVAGRDLTLLELGHERVQAAAREVLGD